MAKRYGRKKKRSHLQQIRDLKAAVKNLQEINMKEYTRASMAEQRYRDAKDLALKAYLGNSGLMQDAINRISDSLARQLGKELHPYAMKLFNAAEREMEASINFFTDNRFNAQMQQCEVIHVEIPRIRFSMMLGLRP